MAGKSVELSHLVTKSMVNHVFRGKQKIYKAVGGRIHNGP